jgi:HTH-type transcriptional regulator/antitoxin HigA
MPSEVRVRPIRSAGDHRAALERIAELMDDDGEAAIAELEVLSVLVDDYERKKHPIAPPDPIEAIRFRLEQEGLTRKDLEPLIGSRARVSEVLAGKRDLSKAMIVSLHERLEIPYEALLAPPSPVPRTGPDEATAPGPRRTRRRRR